MTTTDGLPHDLVTTDDVTRTLRDLGIAGRVVMVHTSMRRVGTVVGGEDALLRGILDAAGPTGTVVMPTQSWQLCDPAFLRDPAVDPAAYARIREQLPAYDPARTPTRTMGAVAELFRTWPGVLRSGHPQRSVAAHGPLAGRVVAVHDLDDSAGERSPMRALEDLDALVCLLGVGFESCTALHLAENRTVWPGQEWVDQGAPMTVDGERRWVTWREVLPADEDFAACGAEFRDTHPAHVRAGRIGAADVVVVPVRELVEFATRWFVENRGGRPVGG